MHRKYISMLLGVLGIICIVLSLLPTSIYAIVQGPKFGYPVEQSKSKSFERDIVGNRYMSPDDGHITHLYAYIKNNRFDSSGGWFWEIRGLIYDGDMNLLAVSEAFNVEASNWRRWIPLAFEPEVEIHSGENYVICVSTEGNMAVERRYICYKELDGNTVTEEWGYKYYGNNEFPETHSNQEDFTLFPQTIDLSHPNWYRTDDKYCIYALYEREGEPNPPPEPDPDVTWSLTTKKGIGGTVDPYGTNSYSEGSTITVTALPNQGYFVDKWLINEVEQGHNQSSIEIYMDRDYEVKVYFTHVEPEPKPKYSITFADNPNGDIMGWEGRTIEEPEDTKIQLRGIPDEGYDLEYFVIDEYRVDADANNEYVLTVTDDHHVSAQFTENGKKTPNPPPKKDGEIWSSDTQMQVAGLSLLVLAGITYKKDE
jgi:hypothetical protein